MEISDYLRSIGKRAWLLVLIPALAGIAVALLTLGDAPGYRTVATIQLPRRDNASPAQVAQQYIDYRAAATSPAVQQAAADNAGVTRTDVRKVRLKQVSDSNLATMTYLSPDKNPDSAVKVVNSLHDATVAFLFQSELQQASDAVEEANAAVQKADAEAEKIQEELTALQTELQTNSPVDEVDRIEAQLRTYQSDRLRTLTEGNQAGADLYAKEIYLVTQRLIDLQKAIPDFQRLTNDLVDANRELASLEQVAKEAEAGFIDAQPVTDVTFSQQANPVRRNAQAVKSSAVAVLAAVPLAVGLLLLLDLMARRRRGGGPGDDEGTHEGGPGPSAQAAPLPGGAPDEAAVAPVGLVDSTWSAQPAAPVTPSAPAPSEPAPSEPAPVLEPVAAQPHANGQGEWSLVDDQPPEAHDETWDGDWPVLDEETAAVVAAAPAAELDGGLLSLDDWSAASSDLDADLDAWLQESAPTDAVTEPATPSDLDVWLPSPEEPVEEPTAELDTTVDETVVAAGADEAADAAVVGDLAVDEEPVAPIDDLTVADEPLAAAELDGEVEGPGAEEASGVEGSAPEEVGATEVALISTGLDDEPVPQSSVGAFQGESGAVAPDVVSSSVVARPRRPSSRGRSGRSRARRTSASGSSASTAGSPSTTTTTSTESSSSSTNGADSSESTVTDEPLSTD